MKNIVRKIIVVLVIAGLNGLVFLPLSLRAQGFDWSSFGGGGDLVTPTDPNQITIDPNQAETPVVEDLGTASTEGVEEATSVSIFSRTINDLLRATKSNTKITSRQTTALTTKEKILDKIVTVAARLVIRNITVELVNWINGNDEKPPSFLNNPSAFFNNLAINEILGFKNELADSKNPFANVFLKNLTEGVSRKFSENARYSFNEVLSGTPSLTGAVSITVDDFTRDFRQGNWSAWLAMTQVPYNNPIGAQIEFSQVLSKRLGGLYQPVGQQIREELIAGTGFLGQRKCLNPPGVTEIQDQRNFRNTGQSLCTGGWEYTTPGKTLADKITWAETSPIRQLELADEITEGISAVLDALINKIWMQMAGLMDRDEETEKPDFKLPDLTDNQQFIPGNYLNSDWFASHPDFDIGQGISQAIIDEQRTYLEKLEGQQKALAELVNSIYQADYCLPGPNPNWRTTAEENFNSIAQRFAKIEAVLIQAQAEEVDKMAIWTFEMARFFRITIKPETWNTTDSSVLGQIRATLDSYDKRVTDIYSYSQLYMPTVTREIQTEYKKIVGYQSIIEKNNETIPAVKAVIRQLELLKKELDLLILQYEGLRDDPEFAKQMRLYGQRFARLTLEMFSGNDIAGIDDFRKQIEDQSMYVRDMLKKGCEDELADLKASDPTAFGLYAAYRMPGHPASYSVIGGQQDGSFLHNATYYSWWGGATNCNGQHSWPPSPIPPLGHVLLGVQGGGYLNYEYDGSNKCGVIQTFESQLGVY